MQVPGLRGLAPGKVAKRTFDEFLQDDMLTYAAALSYHLLFSLFPFILFLIALLGFLNLPGLFDSLVGWADRALPEEAMRQVTQVVREVEGSRNGGLLSLGIATAVWVASVGMRSTMNALNKAYDIREDRARWKRYSLSIVYTLAFAVLVVLATALMVVGPLVMARLANELGLGEEVLFAWSWLRLPTALLVAMLAVSLVYYFAPNVEQRFRLFTPGSVLAVLLWAVVSVAFRYYVENFGSYDVTYGSIGAVIILLLYFFLSACLLLLGGELNAVIQCEAPRPEDGLPDPEKEAGQEAPKRRRATSRR